MIASRHVRDEQQRPKVGVGFQGIVGRRVGDLVALRVPSGEPPYRCSIDGTWERAGVLQDAQGALLRTADDAELCARAVPTQIAKRFGSGRPYFDVAAFYRSMPQIILVGLLWRHTARAGREREALAIAGPSWTRRPEALQERSELADRQIIGTRHMPPTIACRFTNPNTVVGALLGAAEQANQPRAVRRPVEDDCLARGG